MKFTLPAGARVAIHSPGTRIAETVHALSEQGATVAVTRPDATTAQAPDIAAQLTDLASRRLVSVIDELDVTAYDVVFCDPLGRPVPMTGSATGTGEVVLIGGGPGDPGLLTVAGLAALREADVVVTDRLAPLSVLADLEAHVEVIHVGKIPRGEFTPQERINAILIEHASAGRRVARLKGGDSFVFGRGGEEWNACVEAGIPVRVIPGVTSSIAAPALAGIPVTHRHLAQGFIVVSGHVPPGDPRGDVDWAALAHSGLTIVILMGVATLPAITDAFLEAGMPADTPAASVSDAGMPSQAVVRATLSNIAAAMSDARMSAPAVSIIGPAAAALTQP